MNSFFLSEGTERENSHNMWIDKDTVTLAGRIRLFGYRHLKVFWNKRFERLVMKTGKKTTEYSRGMHSTFLYTKSDKPFSDGFVCPSFSHTFLYVSVVIDTRSLGSYHVFIKINFLSFVIHKQNSWSSCWSWRIFDRRRSIKLFKLLTILFSSFCT